MQILWPEAPADEYDCAILACAGLLGQDFRGLHDLAHGLQQEPPGRRAQHTFDPDQISAAMVNPRLITSA